MVININKYKIYYNKETKIINNGYLIFKIKYSNDFYLMFK